MKVDGPLPESTADTNREASHLELRSVLDDLLCRHNPNLGRIVRLESSPCADRTSFNLVDLEIELEDGSILRLLLKDLGMKNLHETARRVKPEFLYNPLREIKTYQEILAREPPWHGAFLWGGRQAGRGSSTGFSWRKSRA